MLVAKRFSFFLDGLGLDSRSRGGLLRRGLGSGPGWVAGVTPYATVGLFFTKNHWRGFCIKKLMKYNRTKFFLAFIPQNRRSSNQTKPTSIQAKRKFSFTLALFFSIH